MYTEVHCISALFHVPHKHVWMGGGRQGVTIVLVHTCVCQCHPSLCPCASLPTAVSLLPPSPGEGHLPGGVWPTEDLPPCACACADGCCE